jgi:predicted nucleic acid-binding protein
MAGSDAPAIVLDSSFLVAYHNTRDVHHAAAARAMVQICAGRWGRALLLEYVLLEVATVLLMRRGLKTAVETATTLLDAAEVDFVPCSELFGGVLRAFAAQRSGRLSFVDAAIAMAARDRAGGYVATFDADFGAETGITMVPG